MTPPPAPPATARVPRTDAALASVLRLSVARLVRRLRAERDPDNELSTSQLAVLAHLFVEGELTVGRLAALERVQPPTMTRTVGCLVEEGYVTRRASEDDGRLVLVSLSEQGAQVLAADRKRRDAWLATELRRLSPEEREVLRAAAPLLERLAHA